MKNILILFASVLCLFSCGENKVDMENNSEIILGEKGENIDLLFEELYKLKSFNGNVLIAENGKVILEKSYGLANEEKKKKLNNQTVFELASVSKQFTAMGIVQLQKEGKLSYDDKISEYIPELISYGDITIKNLLIHTGGLPDYMELTEEFWDKSKIATNDDIINLFKEKQIPVDFLPNTKWEYSNTGYLILGSIIERTSGKSFGEYLKEKIFEPLEMNQTFVYQRWFRPQVIDNYAEGYIYSDSLERKVIPDELGKDFYMVYLDGIVGDGMVNSNTRDLLRWDQALYTDNIINDEDRKIIFSSYQTQNNSDTNYGFGWKIKNNDTHGKTVSHSGSWGGYITYVNRHIDNGKTIIILQNNSTPDTEIPLKNLQRILYDLPVEKRITLDNNILERYAGSYSSEDGTEEEIIFKDNKLFIPAMPQVNLELIPVTSTKFILDGFRPEVTFTFLMEKDNYTNKYRVQQVEKGLDKIASKKS